LILVLREARQRIVVRVGIEGIPGLRAEHGVSGVPVFNLMSGGEDKLKKISLLVETA
jgi:hypothetical protein